MEVFDAPPVAAPTSADAPAEPKRAGVMETFGQELKHAGKLAIGMEQPQGILDHVMVGLSLAPMIALGGAGAKSAAERIGLPLLAKAAPVIGRIATSAGLEAGRAAVGDHDPLTGAALGAAGGAIGEGGAAIGGRALKHMAKPVAERAGSMAARGAAEVASAAGEAMRGAEGARVGQAAGKILPELETTSADELYGVAKDWGKRQLDRVFEPALNEIKARIGGGGAKWINAPAISKGRVTLDDAVDALGSLKGAERFQARGQIVSELNRLDPKGEAGAIFDEAMKTRAAARTYLTILNKSLDESGRFDPARAASFVNRERGKLEQFAGRYWPAIEQAVLGGSAPVNVAARKIPNVKMPDLAPEPGLGARMAAKTMPFLQSPATRAGADAITSQPTPAALGTLALTEALPQFATRALRHIPGVGRAVSAAEGSGE